MGRKVIDEFMDMAERDFGEGRLKPGSVCVLWKGSLRARLVKVTRRSDSRNEGVFWYTKPYLERGYPEKRVHEDELTLVENEMEIIAWAAKLSC